MTITGAATYTANIPGFTDISALFDQVMLDKVTCRFRFLVDPAAFPAGGAGIPVLYTALDYNDSNPPVVLDDIQQYSSLKINSLAVELGPAIRVIRPCYPKLLFNSVAGTVSTAGRGYVPSNADIPHYGLKGYLLMNNPAIGATFQGTCFIEVEYIYKCKNLV